MADFARSLAVESWTLYAIGICLIALRILSRRIVLGSFRKLQLDDYLMLFIIFTFTGDVVSVNQVAVNGSNYLPPGEAEKLSTEEVKAAVWGSKMTVALEEFQLTTTWLVKACLLLMYSRLTMGLKEHRVVKIVAAYCAFGYLLVQVLYFAVWCHPIEEYWRVPFNPNKPQCISYINHMITATVFNVSSDLMMLCIPIPLVIRTTLPLRRKLILCGVFSLGIFVILTAVLNRYYNFTVPYSPIFLDWYIGEAATAVYVANVPLLWPLLKSIFNLDTWSRAQSTFPSHSHSNEHSHHSRFYRTKIRPERLEGSSDRIVGHEGTPGGPSGWNEEHEMRTGSEERIISAGCIEVQTLKATDGSLELMPYGSSGYRTRVGTRLNEDVEKGEIVRTVEIEQYSS
ncbi:uncharacterized protein K441DRAFT_661911 [Cenococcum geophilum 1.58]|uniref:uncharacterized protein n=1 Tax=Cenococcum geophilum 1.58 TaxID=794803 RepID=UPI00358F65B4|nr:hypothetical protein K441DRAFT_661911 [Cenococcum geophilum 1.58]